MFHRLFGKKSNPVPDPIPVSGELRIAHFSFHSPQAYKLQTYGETVDFDGMLLSSGDLVRDEVRRLANDITLCRLKSGGFCLRLNRDIPTFDSADREYDSWHRLYILPAEEGLTGLYVAGGYRLAEARCYRQIAGSDEASQSLLQSLVEQHE